jgi:glutathione synthase/RimK-type ligase-like ATP-grasp enzyme
VKPGALALLTLDDRSAYVIDDDLAVAELRARGHAVEEIPWRRRGVDWRVFDLVIIRTTWDYQHDLPGFLAALAAIEATGVPLANPGALVRWNARKTYLRDLAARGVAVVPTRWGHGLSAAGLASLCAGFGDDGCVLKPTVSANAHDTFRLPRAVHPTVAAEVAARFADREWMAQPFVRAVVDEGEFSVFYFDGAYSHAIVKRPKSGDFRVQEEHGGLITPIEPDAALRGAADRVMAALDAAPLQARVDLVRLDDGALALMELEAIEPSLYFRTHPRAAAHFADAVARYLARLPRR